MARQLLAQSVVFAELPSWATTTWGTSYKKTSLRIIKLTLFKERGCSSVFAFLPPMTQSPNITAIGFPLYNKNEDVTSTCSPFWNALPICYSQAIRNSAMARAFKESNLNRMSVYRNVLDNGLLFEVCVLFLFTGEPASFPKM
jgi:hypothetical protein